METTGVQPPPEDPPKTNPWIIVIAVVVLLCCCCVGVVGLLFAFGQPVLNSLGIQTSWVPTSAFL